jgi:hypothetical protein
MAWRLLLFRSIVSSAILVPHMMGKHHACFALPKRPAAPETAGVGRVVS